jgi:mono/diheme cytochrome c family protein
VRCCRHMPTLRVVAGTTAAIFILIIGTAFLFLRSGGLSARKKPSNIEYAIANWGLAQSIPASSKATNSPLTISSAVTAEARRDFHDYCAVCHGDDGVGKTLTAAGMSPEVPDLHADHVQNWTDGQLFFIIQNGVRFTGMPSWNFEDDKIWRLVVHVRTFRSNSGTQR